MIGAELGREWIRDGIKGTEASPVAKGSQVRPISPPYILPPYWKGPAPPGRRRPGESGGSLLLIDINFFFLTRESNQRIELQDGPTARGQGLEGEVASGGVRVALDKVGGYLGGITAPNAHH